MTTRAKFINTAAGELGVKESPRGSNRTKYTRAFGLTGPWCAMFIWWVAGQAGAVAVKAGAVAGKAGAVAAKAGAVAVKAGAVADHFAVSAINFNVTLVVIKFRCNS